MFKIFLPMLRHQSYAAVYAVLMNGIGCPSVRPSVSHSVDWLWQADWSNTLIRRPLGHPHCIPRRRAQRPYLSWAVVVIGWTRFNQVPLISLGYSALDPSAGARPAGLGLAGPGRAGSDWRETRHGSTSAPNACESYCVMSLDLFHSFVRCEAASERGCSSCRWAELAQ